MCNSISTQTYTSNVVRSLVNKGELFTAYDVTKSLRADGINVLHPDVRDVVKELYTNQSMGVNYKRTLMTVVGNFQAFVYHPYNEDPQNYKDAVPAAPVSSVVAAVQPSVPATPAVTSSTNPVAATPRTRNNTKGVVDKWRRVRVPSSVTRAAGLAPGDVVYASPTVYGLLISKNPGTKSNKETVDVYGNIRIGLSKLGVRASQFNFTTSNNDVVGNAV